MPRNGLGVASQPANTRGGPANTPISSTKYNQVVDDIYQLFNDALPITAGGTGGTSVTSARTNLELDKKVVYAEKSANYTTVAADNNAILRFTASATLSLTAVATLGANWHVTVFADGGDVTIDPNASEQIDGATTVVIPNGYAAEIISSGSAFFTDKAWSTVLAKLQPFATVASATTTDIGAATSQNVTVTGTTTITSFGTVAAGTFRRLVFSGALTLTHNATSLILPQGGNVVTAAGDSLEAVSLGSGNWRVTSYQRVGSNGLVSGTAVAASGTAVDFTSIPSWAKRIMVSYESLSTNGTTGVVLQLGDSGGIETSGYAFGTSNAVAGTSDFPLTGGSGAAAAVYHGVAILTLINSATNTWAISAQTGRSDTSALLTVAGSKSTSAVLDRVRIKSTNGTDTFDAGSINILYE